MNSKSLMTEVHENFLLYAHEVNCQRAFPDARDGCKPGQRAALWEMYVKGYTSNKPHVKSAKVSGGVAASFWPHGTTSIYETFVRMSQPWLNNMPEVDFHGNNGSVQISPEAAAERYTEVRLAKSTEDGLLCNIKKNNVPMIWNFSEDEQWPKVFPAIYPRLMVNGSQGIGSTIANHWSMYNLKELYEVIKKYVESGNLDYSTLYPDYPSGGVIINKKDLAAIHATGKGKIILQAKARVEKNKIFITELPYQVYVEPLIEEIKKYALENENSGIDDVLNKSDKKGMLIEIDCESDPSGVLARLFKETSLQKTYNPNQFALVDDVPQLLNLKMYIDNYLKHNKECIMRETEYDLEKAASRLEIVEGLVKALEDIDNIISLIKSSESAAKAVEKLIEKYGFTQVQAKAIVDMKLGRLANLEKIELNKEKEELTSKIVAAKDILSSDTRWKEIYMERFSSFVKKYGTDRRTEVIQAEITKEEKEVVEIVPEDVVISITRNGLVKRTPKSAYKIQNKGGKGIKSANEALLKVIPTNTIDYLLLFSNRGKMYRLLVDNIPDAAKGTLLSSLVKIDSGESIIAATALSRGGDYKYITFFTKNGLIKRTLLSEYTEAKKTQGIQAIKIKDGDDIVNIVFSKEEDNYIIVSKCGFAIRVKGGDINTTGRTTIGMKGITLGKDDEVIFGSNTTKDDKYLGVLTDGGYGKKTELSEFVIQGRGGKGITTFKATSDAEHIAAAVLIKNGDSVLISGISSTLCVAEKDIPTLGRTTHGNIVMKGKVLSAIVL